MRRQAGSVDVIESTPLVTGSVHSVELRAQDPAGPYGRPMLALVAGHYPTGADQVALTRPVANLYNLRVGDVWRQDGRARTVVGLVANPGNLLDEFALVAPGQLGRPGKVTILFDEPPPGPGFPANGSTFQVPKNASLATPPPPSAGINPAVVVLALATFGLIFIGLVAVSGFTVLAQRRLRGFGMLSALGATDRNIRLVTLAGGTIVGIAGTLAGAVLGIAAWVFYAPHLEASVAHRVKWSHLPWWAVVTAMILAVVTSVVAAWWPARSAARIPVVAALSGRPTAPKAVRWHALRGIVLLVAGPWFLAFAGGWGGTSTRDQLFLIVGILATTIGCLLLAPTCIAALGVVARHAPIAVRLALRVTFAVLVAVLTCVVTTARYADPVDYFGPNLAANEVVVYLDDSISQGFATDQNPSHLRDLESRVRALAASLHAGSLALNMAVNPGAPAAGPPGAPAFASARRIGLDATSWVEHVPGWLTGGERLLEALIASAAWEQRDRWMVNRIVVEPRLTAEYPDIADAPEATLRTAAAVLSEHYRVPYDGLWINLYRDHRDSTGWHGDRPTCKRDECVVPVLSLGATRRFLLRPRQGGRSTALTPVSGDLIVMGGARISVNFSSRCQAVRSGLAGSGAGPR